MTKPLLKITKKEIQYEFTDKINYDKYYLKVISKSKTHYNMPYRIGYNEDVHKFNSNKNETCCKGRLYFTSLKYIYEFFHYGERVAIIKLLPDQPIIKEDKKYGTHKFKIVRFFSLNKFLELVKTKIIECNAYFSSLRSAKGLENLRTINGDADFYNLTSAKGLERLKIINGDAYFSSLKSATGLENLKTIDGRTYFSSLTSAKELERLETINGYANFRNLTSAKGLKRLETINGYANFRNLASAKGLENLRTINGYADFYNLPNSEKQKIPALRRK